MSYSGHQTDDIRTGTTTPGQSGHGSNDNEEMAPQSPKGLENTTSSPDAVLYHIQITLLFFLVGVS